MLYTLSHPFNRCDVSALLHLIMKDDVLLLLQDGVIAGLSGSVYIELLLNMPISLYALQDDLEARGLIGYCSNKITIIGYSDFVTLTEKHGSQIAC